MGLLGLAFHPSFRENRKYYVTYNPGAGPLATVLEERQADATFRKDAGGGVQEEVNLIKRGGNYGWSQSEGFNNVGGSITAPVHGLTRSEGRCIIGGYVHRGSPSSKFFSQFLIGDYETRRAWAIKPGGMDRATATALADLPAKISSWGTDAAGRLYFLGHETGRAYLLEGADWGGGTTGLASMPPRTGYLRERYGRVEARLAGRSAGVVVFAGEDPRAVSGRLLPPGSLLPSAE